MRDIYPSFGRKKEEGIVEGRLGLRIFVLVSGDHGVGWDEMGRDGGGKWGERRARV